MKKMILGFILSMSAAIAFALPAPAQIEAAIAAKDYQTAAAMTQQVIAEKPDSARGHLLNGYVLLKQGDKQGAAAEVANVQRLDERDPGHTVRGSALYGRLVAELEAPVAAPVMRQAVYIAPRPVMVVRQDHTGRNLLLGFIVALLVFWLVWLIFFREDEVVVVRGGYSPPYVPTRSTSTSGFYGGPVMQQPTVVVHDNGMNGLAAGMMMGSMMNHGHMGYGGMGGGVYVDPGYGLVGGGDVIVDSGSSYVEPSYSAPSYDSSPSSYSSGSGSSYDSGSSYSSSSDSGSSYDSGGSSGGWD